MKISFLVLFVLGPIVGVASAQTTYSNSSNGSIGTGTAAFTVGQTFTGLSGVQAVTWYVDSTSNSATTVGFRAYLGEWNTGSNSLTANTLQLLGSTSVERSASQSQVPVGFSFSPVALDTGKTYALLFSYHSGSLNTNVVAGVANGNAFFNSGNSFYYTTASNSGSFESALGSAPNFNYPGGDLMMSVQTSAIPEPSTYALICGIAMLGLTCYRRRRAG